MYDDSEVIFQLYLEGAAEDMTTSNLTKLGAPADVLQMFLQKDNGKLVFKPEHVSTLYGWIKDQRANKTTLKSDYQNYLKLFQNTPLHQFKSYVDWTQQIHAKRDEATYHSRHKHLKDIELEGEDKANVLADDADVLILKGDDEHKCVRYGKGYSFCISRPGGGNMYDSYRTTKASTFYFVFFKNVPKSDPKHIMVLDVTYDGWEWTFANNDTKTVKGGWNEIVQTFPVLKKYEKIFVNKPMTPEEEALIEKTSSFADDPTKKKFDKFTYAERAHVLKSGPNLPFDVFQSLDKYLRNEWVSVGPPMSDEIYSTFTPTEIARFNAARKQQMLHRGPSDKFDIHIYESDAEFRELAEHEMQIKVDEYMTKIRRLAAETKDKLHVNLSNDPHSIPPSMFPFLTKLPDMSDLDNRVRVVNCNGTLVTSLEGLPQGVEDVYCTRCELTTLEGLQHGVKQVHCGHNQLTTLEGLPQGVVEVHCYDNQLTTLEGLPQGVKMIICYNNQLTTLEGLPQGVEHVNCTNNQLTNLIGLPQSVKTVVCNRNQLTTLEGLPQGVKTVYSDGNPVNFTKQDIENAKRGIFSKRVLENTNLAKLLKQYLLSTNN